MSARMPGIAVYLLVAVVALGLADRAHSQGREPQRPEIRGVVKSVDASKIIISTPGEGREAPPIDKSYPVAKNVEVAVGVGAAAGGRGGAGLAKEAKLTDLSAGTRVSLTLSADKKEVESILAEVPLVRGLLKAVDTVKSTLTISQPAQRGQEVGEEKSYTVAADAEIGVDDGRGRRFSIKEAKLTDLAQAAHVTAWLALDSKQVQGILAEGPTFFGVLKQLDAAKKHITLVVRPARGDDAGDEKMLTVANDAMVLLDDGKGRRLSLKQVKLADVPVGSTVAGKLTVDQTAVTLLKAEGPMMSGLLKGVDADKGIIIIGIVKGRNDINEKTLNLAKDVRVTLDGAASTLANLKVGENAPMIQLRLTLDQKTVQSVAAWQPRQR